MDNVMEGLMESRQSYTTTGPTKRSSEFRQQLHSGFADDVAILFVIIASLIAVTSGGFVMYGFWQTKRQHRRLRKVVEMDSNDFLLYAQVAQHEMSSTPCKTSLPCHMPHVGKTIAGVPPPPIIVPGYVRIVQLTYPAAEEQNPQKGKRGAVAVEKPKNKVVEICRLTGPNLPKSTSSAPAILRGLWKQRHLLTGNKDTLVDSFTALKKPSRPQPVRASLSDTTPMIDRSVDQSRQSTCENCGSGSSLLGGTFPRNISCRLCRERTGIQDVGVTAAAATKRTIQESNFFTTTNTSLHTMATARDAMDSSVATPHKSPGRPRLSTFPDRRRKSCTPEVRAQLDPFRTMVLASSSSEDFTSDSDS